jgi:TfoX/Sxy family transcriptional regulator of competence genes
MPYDPRLADRMRAALARRPAISERAMFGSFCWMLNGNMLCGVEVGRFMFRVGKELETKALARPGAEPIVFSGRRMGGLVWVKEEACRGRALTSWIELASRFVGTLPPQAR